MNRPAALALVVTLLAGCVVAAPAPSALPGTAFSGEVWTWDERTNVVTLRVGTETVRVKVTPDQIRGLELHRFVTLRGELAPPADIEQVIVVPGPTRIVPRGSPQQSEITGMVSATDPKGLASIDAGGNRLIVWTAMADASTFRPGTPVRLRMIVQPVDLVPLTDPRAGAPMPPDPSASIATAPGDHAVVTGRVIAVDPRGTISVESPRGPVTVAVADPSGHRLGATVQVRTLLQQAR